MGEVRRQEVRYDVGSEVEWIALERLISLQGNLKSLEEAEYQKLRKQILENGFSFAVHVWTQHTELDASGLPLIHILDGHQRCEALRRMRDEGIEIGLSVPCLPVHAKDKASAISKLLGAASQFGTFHVEQVGPLAEVAGLGMEAVESMVAIPGLTELKINELVEEVNMGDENAEWVGNLPEFKTSEKLIKLTIVFGSLDDREKFVDEHKITVTNKMCGQWTSTL